MNEHETQTVEQRQAAELPVDLNASADAIATRIEDISAGEAAQVLQALDPAKAADVAEVLDPNTAAHILAKVNLRRAPPMCWRRWSKPKRAWYWPR